MAVPISSVYDELMHYTTFAGLSGIVSSGLVRATDASFLNDAREISHYFDTRLEAVVEPEVRRFAYENARNPESLARIIEFGGFQALIKEEASILAQSIRAATIEMNRPFVLSLCGAPDDRVRRSGLLSQWRGYGPDGGYALVFDSKGIEQALAEETKAFAYMHILIGDVYYEGVDPIRQPAKSEFEEMEAVVRQGAARMLRNQKSPEQMADFYHAVTGLSCTFKHWGFWEEREVRVVAIPTPSDLLAEGPVSPALPKEVKTFTRENVSVPYVELFSSRPESNPRGSLPLKRVIVGPHRDRTSRTGQVVELLRANGYDIEVVESEIPYLGR